MHGPAETDQDLVVAVRGGDAAALRSLYDRHGPWLAIRLTRRCADPAIVEEVVQDTRGVRGAARYRVRAVAAYQHRDRRPIDRMRKHRTARGSSDAPTRPSAESSCCCIEHGDLASAWTGSRPTSSRDPGTASQLMTREAAPPASSRQSSDQAHAGPARTTEVLAWLARPGTDDDAYLVGLIDDAAAFSWRRTSACATVATRCRRAPTRWQELIGRTCARRSSARREGLAGRALVGSGC
jgi:RNA polymerase sigma-70 factor (ECF subfamily)